MWFLKQAMNIGPYGNIYKQKRLDIGNFSGITV